MSGSAYHTPHASEHRAALDKARGATNDELKWSQRCERMVTERAEYVADPVTGELVAMPAGTRSAAWHHRFAMLTRDADRAAEYAEAMRTVLALLDRCGCPYDRGGEGGVETPTGTDDDRRARRVRPPRHPQRRGRGPARQGELWS